MAARDWAIQNKGDALDIWPDDRVKPGPDFGGANQET